MKGPELLQHLRLIKRMETAEGINAARDHALRKIRSQRNVLDPQGPWNKFQTRSTNSAYVHLTKSILDAAYCRKLELGICVYTT